MAARAVAKSGVLWDPGVTAHTGLLPEARQREGESASLIVVFLLSSSLPIALHKCAIDVKWVPRHIRAGR